MFNDRKYLNLYNLLKYMLKKILVAIDGSPQSSKALDIAIDMAKRFESKLYIVHVIEEQKYMLAINYPPAYPEMVDSLLKNAKELLDEAAKKAMEQGVNAEQLLERGDAASKIIDAADNLCVDMIVMGSRGLRGVTKFLLGSVSERVVKYSKRPVMVIK
ncbi:universal stress protein YxiE [Thermocladium modestius]|uniref:Universal stress protein YxiE n=2 Tax=Thermocladium modestius TaxID=62609 RepID=A0A830GXT5_9CREN|nr:universal stress protein YxiE [Thermocladium modestius]